MANQRLETMTINDTGMEVSLIYNDANNRLVSVQWVVHAGYVVRFKIWDRSIDQVNPVIDKTEGEGTGAESIPGNYRLVETVDPDEPGVPVLELPANIGWSAGIKEFVL